MALWQVCPELRKRRIQATMVAWFPWKSEVTGLPMCDSTGLFMCNLQVDVDLCCELSHVHDNDETGLLFKDRSGGQMWATVCEQGGPGQAFSAYLPKSAKTIFDKLRPTLEKLGDHSPVLRMREKRTGFDIWAHGNTIRKGSHFPLLVFTDTPGRRRTPEGAARRAEKWKAHCEKKSLEKKKEKQECLSGNSQRRGKSESRWSGNSQWRGKPESRWSRHSWQESSNVNSWTSGEWDQWHARNDSGQDGDTWWRAASS